MSSQEDKGEDWMPLYMSMIAGASTCLGAAVVFCHPKSPDGTRLVSANTMSFSLALAASVMVTVSVVSLGPECLQNTDSNADAGFELMPLWSHQFLQRIIACGSGCVLYFSLSWFAFPEPDAVLGLEIAGTYEEAKSLKGNPKKPTFVNEKSRQKSKTKALEPTMRIRRKEPGYISVGDDEDQLSSSTDSETSIGKSASNNDDDNDKFSGKPATWKTWTAGADLSKDQRRAWRVAMLLFVSLLCHNFPEGLAVAAAALESRKLGITVTIGIMIHNIPEGIAIAIPCLAARPESPWLSFALASLSGLAEPVGAFVALLFLRKVSEEEDDATIWNMENVLAFVAGIMVTVAMYELFPEAKRHTTHGKKHFIAGTLAGIVIMVATELFI